MLLVIPRLDIRDGLADYGRLTPGGHMLEDPVAMARLWRVQNAKTILLRPREDPATSESLSAVLEVCRTLDIPVQVDCETVHRDRLTELLDCGAYRTVLSDRVGVSQFAEFAGLYGPRRLAVKISEGITNADDADRCAVRVRSFADHGCCRFLIALTREALSSELGGLLNTLSGVSSRARFTVIDCVEDYASLAALQQTPRCVDSVVVGEALYANRFPCQASWCWHAVDTTDLERFTTATLLDDESGKKSPPRQ